MQTEQLTFPNLIKSYLSKDWVQEIINYIAAIAGPLLVASPLRVENETLINFSIRQKSLIIFIIGYGAYLICVSKQKRAKKKEDQHKIDQLQIVEKETSLARGFVNSNQVVERSLQKINREIAVETKRTANRMLFDKAAQLICAQIYMLLTDYLKDVDVRVCVTKQVVDKSGEKFICQVGYYSPTCAMANNLRKPLSKFDYYTAKILKNNTEEYSIFLTEEEVRRNLTLKKGGVVPKRFVAIPYKEENFAHIFFVLQIDFSEERIIGKDYKEAERFINTYIRPFALRLGNIYYSDLVNQNGEV